jgi:hypothetical protein
MKVEDFFDAWCDLSDVSVSNNILINRALKGDEKALLTLIMKAHLGRGRAKHKLDYHRQDLIEKFDLPKQAGKKEPWKNALKGLQRYIDKRAAK